MRFDRIGKLTLAVALVLVLGAPVKLIAQDGGAAAGQLHEVDHLIGEWTLRSYSRDSSGKFVEADVTTSYRARYLHDGLSILAEFFEENREGFYGVHLISRASETELVHYYLNARADRRIEFRGMSRDGEYYLSRAGGYGEGDFLYREIDSNIQADSFVKRIYRSDDNGVTWTEGNFYFRFERVGGSGAD